MNPEYDRSILRGSFVFLVILFLTVPVTSFAQDDVSNDSLSRAFYDTLKVRSENSRLTRLLYDIMIVSPVSGKPARENMGSTKPFSQFEGQVIRSCKIIRLNAFGTDINDPQTLDPSGIERVLNKTYIKSQDFVLRKYLLFEEGDTISSLTLSDNERLLRDLSFIEDVRIEVIPVQDNQADIIVLLKENYPMGFDIMLSDLTSGKVTLFNRNFGGLGHDLDVTLPYKFKEYPYPGIGVKYAVRNISHTFSNLAIDFSDGLGTTTAGGSFSRGFVSADTKYAWSASLRMTYTTEDLDTMTVPGTLGYTYQDYWLARSFMLNRESVTRLIFSGRYINNNVFNKPEINDNSFYRLQRYQFFIGSIALSRQKYINTSLIYSYGRTENIPFGFLIEVAGGREINEFKHRAYLGLNASCGNIFNGFGYIYGGVGFSTFYNQGQTEQGMLQTSVRYFTPLIRTGRSKVRSFLNIYYTRGFNRYSDESLYLKNSSFIRGFENDSVSGNHRLAVNLEHVLFMHRALYGFKFAFFTYADGGFIIRGTLNEGAYTDATGFGVGVRIRNDQLVLKTVQIRFGFYPWLPPYSQTSWASIDGLVRLKPPGFEPGPPEVTAYR